MRLNAEVGLEVHGQRAAVDDALPGGAVAVGVVGVAVELLAPITGRQLVVLVGEGVAPLRAKFV